MRTVRFLVLVLAVMSLASARGFAATFVVNSTADNLNPPAGTVTLRSAIQAANAGPGPNTIQLSVAGTYTMTIAPAYGQTPDNSSGAFCIQPSGGNLTITNTSGGTVVVDGNQLDHVFVLDPGSGATPFSVTFSGFTIRNGAASDGAGIWSAVSVNLTLTGMTVSDNGAKNTGGGVRIAGGSLTLHSCTLSNNTASDGAGIRSANTTLAIDGSTLSGNKASTSGAGIYVTGGTCTVQGTTFTQNQGNFGGGMETAAPVTLASCTFTANSSGFGGGAVICDNNVVTVQACTFTGNTGATFGGALCLGSSSGEFDVDSSTFVGNSSSFSGGAVCNAGTTTTTRISNSTFTGNTAPNGGALDLSGATNTLSNDTIVGNTATGQGGGINMGTSNVTLDCCTITGNKASTGGGVYFTAIRPPTPYPTSCLDTIIAGNTANTAPDVTGSVHDLGGNLIGVTGTGGGTSVFDAPTTQTGTVAAPLNPVLGPLQNNGGPTQTVALLTGSPAIAKGITTTQTTDQRGVSRPQATAPCIGAFELVQGPSPNASLPASFDFGSQGLGVAGTQSVVLTNSGTGPLTVSALSISGANAGDFVLVTSPTTVAAGGTLPIQITFTPQGLGARTTTLTVTDNAGSVPNSKQTVTLTGTGTPAAAIVTGAGTTPQSIGEGQAFLTPLSALVTDASGNPVANVTVTFTAPSSGASGTFASGSTTFTTTTGANGVATSTTFTANMTAGSYSVTASSNGLTTAFRLTNLVPDFTITANPSSLTVGPGQTGTIVFTVTPINGYNQPVHFSISGLPAGVTGSFSPETVTPNGAPVTSTLTIVNSPSTASASLLALCTVLPLLGMSLVGGRRRVAALLVAIGLVGVLLAGCGSSQGGSGTFNAGDAPVASPTTSTTTPVTVTASSGDGNLNHSATVNIIITR